MFERLYSSVYGWFVCVKLVGFGFFGEFVVAFFVRGFILVFFVFFCLFLEGFLFLGVGFFFLNFVCFLWELGGFNLDGFEVG